MNLVMRELAYAVQLSGWTGHSFICCAIASEAQLRKNPRPLKIKSIYNAPRKQTVGCNDRLSSILRSEDITNVVIFFPVKIEWICIHSKFIYFCVNLIQAYGIQSHAQTTHTIQIYICMVLDQLLHLLKWP